MLKCALCGRCLEPTAAGKGRGEQYYCNGFCAEDEQANWSVRAARYYLLFPDLRDSDASTFRTSDWEIPNCLAMREGVIPALKVARTALTWPCVNATLGSGSCRRSDSGSFAIDGSEVRSPGLTWVVGRTSGTGVIGLPRRCCSWREAA
jgi:hypothetical protein